MTTLTRLMTPWYRRRDRQGGTDADTPGSLAATAILDHGEPGIRDLLTRARADTTGEGTLAVLECAHAIIRDEVRPVYALDRLTHARARHGVVQRDLGYFSDRDEAFALLGQTLCAPARVVVEPVLRRVAA